MAATIADKFRIKADQCLLALNAPDDFAQKMGPLPKGTFILESGKKPDQIHWFLRNQAQLKKELSKVMRLVVPGVLVWVYFPKGSSKIQTDLTRDKGWDCLNSEEDKFTWLTLVSFDEQWSAFGLRAKTESDQKKAAPKKTEREIYKWANSATKEIILPPELVKAFNKHEKEAAFFHSLAFSHKREYVEWVVTAKKEETKRKRVEGTIEKLAANWKNPNEKGV